MLFKIQKLHQQIYASQSMILIIPLLFVLLNLKIVEMKGKITKIGISWTTYRFDAYTHGHFFILNQTRPTIHNASVFDSPFNTMNDCKGEFVTVSSGVGFQQMLFWRYNCSIAYLSKIISYKVKNKSEINHKVSFSINHTSGCYLESMKN